ncbi:type III polyketide synthase [Streptomyces ochraceiscleroticus]|uniref:Type III polyketide synthase n=1 Tax=Streptomyces ochraceiscleroticus TaxID=47761 RepID=A0ABW1MR62_9ACTN|nr:3-oxoacyl-[acyl-carrier-protein] synthase III C-terminal domain-containing protein [Streptomyces ochraceiscleroticus]
MRPPSGSVPTRPRRTGSGPAVLAAEVVTPPYRYRQEEITSAFAEACLAHDRPARQVLEKISANAGVRTRHMALPLEEYRKLDGFTAANEVWRTTALDLGERALRGALETAGILPEEVDVVVSTTVTGLTVPSLEARLVQRLGLRADVKRIPLFGLGCAAGAAGVARMHDYLRGFPDQVAVLLSVELCSLTVQRTDASTANLVALSLFGDGAAAVVAVGERRAEGLSGTSGPLGPEIVATRSRLYPDSEDVMGWRIGAHGFGIVLSPDVATVAEEQLPKDVHAFLDDHGLTPESLTTWICHPGGPKVIQAVERAFGLPPDALAHTRDSLARRGNLSSASVLDVLRRTMAAPPPAGSWGLLTAMGPGFASELVLLRW